MGIALTWRHGISLSTLYRRSSLCSRLSLLVVRDTKGAVFGGLVEAPLRSSTKNRYQMQRFSFCFVEIEVPGAVQKAIEELFSDSSQHVRSALASVTMGMAPVLGKVVIYESFGPFGYVFSLMRIKNEVILFIFYPLVECRPILIVKALVDCVMDAKRLMANYGVNVLIKTRGRLTLIEVVLGSIGIYFLSIFKVPEVILNALERTRASFFWGGTQESKKLAWIKWPNVLSSCKKGGLNIGRLKSFNLIVGSSNFLHSNGFVPTNSLRFQVGCGTRIRFWKDSWLGDAPLYIRYNRHYCLDQDKDCLIIDRIKNWKWHWNWCRAGLGVRNLAYFRDMLIEISHVDTNSVEDSCRWTIVSNCLFGETCHRIDAQLLPSLATSTTWDKTHLRKVNIFMWRLILDQLPHRLNLLSCGIEIAVISSPSCNGNVESNLHIFFECDIAIGVWSLVRVWCENSFPNFTSIIIGRIG
ncbi:RNA-directed DNA polymerase, eukaryota, reverse transcriptase zinc-binding domain protein [Tanacetum coccineum]